MSNKKPQTAVPKLRFPEFRAAKPWKKARIGDEGFATIYKGKGIAKADIHPDGSTPCIRYGELYTHYGEVINTVLSKTNVHDSQLFFSCKNDVIIPASGETKIDIATASCVMADGVALGSDLNVIRSNHNGVFISYYLNGALKREIAKIAQGDSVVHLYPRQLEKIELFLPTSEEQQKIADCLSSVDKLITAEGQKLETLQDHKKGLMQELFPAEGETLPKRRFQEFRNKKDWDNVTIGGVASKAQKWSFTGGPFGSNLKSSDYTKDGVRVIQLQNIGDGLFLNDYKIFTSEEKADELLSCNIYPGDIILSKMGDPVARACLIPNNHERYVMCSDGIRLAVDKKKFNTFYIYSLLNAPAFRNLAEQSATGSTRKRIGIDVLRNLEIPIPELPEQKKIAECLSSLDDLITAQSKKIETLRDHKEALMQQLFPSSEEVMA